MSQPYQKGWLSYSDQVQLLQQRGLVVSDLRKAEQFLSYLISTTIDSAGIA